jgi:hypothetical protein
MGKKWRILFSMTKETQEACSLFFNELQLSGYRIMYSWPYDSEMGPMRARVARISGGSPHRVISARVVSDKRFKVRVDYPTRTLKSRYAKFGTADDMMDFVSEELRREIP